MRSQRWQLTVILICAAAPFCQAQQKPLPETVIPAIDEAPDRAHSYNWMERHQAVVDRVKQGHVDLILVGDSITHMWGGVPQPGGPGQPLWDKYFGSRNAVNLGFGWDRTQHVLWRLDHGEIDGIQPKVAVVMIGTNNMGVNSTDDIVAGIRAIVSELRHKLKRTKVLLLGIFPRDEKPGTAMRQQIQAVNSQISKLGHERVVTYLDLGDIFLSPDGSISNEIMADYLHPTPKGFAMWANKMEPALAKLFGDKPREQ